MKKKMTNYAAFLNMGFITILVFGMLFSFALPDKKTSTVENRALEQFPTFTVSSYFDGRLENKLDKYLQDQFPFRNSFIKIKVAADQAVGRVKSGGVYKCKDNYLMEDIVEPSGNNQKKTIKTMKVFKAKYPTVSMYFLLAPNAANILAEKLPETASPKNQNASMDQYFKETKRAGIISVDVRKTFTENIDKTQLYYRTDHHWTTDGAYIAYKKAAKVMKLSDTVKYKEYVVKDNFRGTLASKSGYTNGIDDQIKLYLPKKSSKAKNSLIYYMDTKEKTTQFYKMENLKKRDAYTVFGGSNHPVYTVETPVKGGNLLLIKDSYANSIIPFLAQNYRKIVVVDPRYFNDDIKDYMESEKITDVLFLFNSNTFFQDGSLEMMLSS